MRGLALAPGLELPLDAATQTFGVLAKREAGKSNVLAVMAEQMFDARIPFCIVDPVSAHHGLRSSRDGRGPGLPIPILGGHRGDVPLERGAGELVADLIVDEQLSSVLDLSAFESEKAKRQFLTAFGERLFRRKIEPDKGYPLHMFLEEADDYAPQRASGVETNRLLGIFQRIVKQGRGRGFGSTMISQRSATLNKDLLTQIETLIVLRITSPQDRKAIGLWLEHHDVQRELLDSLATLKPGEGWVWSPQYLGRVERVRFHRRRTYDSGATPTLKGRRAPATLADVDLGALRSSMAATIERAKATDPKELQARVRELEGRIRELEARRPAATPAERVDVPVLRAGELEALHAALEGARELEQRLEAATERVAGAAAPVQLELARVVDARRAEAVLGPPVRGPVAPQAPARAAAAARAGDSARAPARPAQGPASGYLKSPSGSSTPAADGELSRYARGLLEAAAARHPMTLTRGQVATLTGRSLRSSSFDTAMGEVVAGAFLEAREGRYTVTARGLAEAGQAPATTSSPEDLQALWLRALPAYERGLLEVLLDAFPAELSREDLAQRANRSPTSSSLDTAIGSLLKNEVAERSSGGLRAAPMFFA